MNKLQPGFTVLQLNKGDKVVFNTGKEEVIDRPGIVFFTENWEKFVEETEQKLLNDGGIEKYLSLIKLNKKSKYLMVISRESGITASDAYQIKLPSYIPQILMVNGNAKEVVTILPLKEKEKNNG